MPSAHALTFSEGQIVADRFRIVRFIAAGGMGELYEAEDLELPAERRAEDDQAAHRPRRSGDRPLQARSAAGPAR